MARGLLHGGVAVRYGGELRPGGEERGSARVRVLRKEERGGRCGRTWAENGAFAQVGGLRERAAWPAGAGGLARWAERGRPRREGRRPGWLGWQAGECCSGPREKERREERKRGRGGKQAQLGKERKREEKRKEIPREKS